MRARRSRVTAEAAQAAAEAVTRWIVESPVFASAPRVALYAALPDELPTRPFFEASRKLGKPTLFPRTTAEGGLEFAPISCWEDLRPGRYGVAEPPGPAAAPLAGDELVLVPSVALDAQGHRLGRGGGYYDRSFPVEGEDAPVLLGVGYAFQVIAEVPVEPGDRRMDWVASEAGLLRIGDTQ